MKMKNARQTQRYAGIIRQVDDVVSIRAENIRCEPLIQDRDRHRILKSLT